VIYKLRHASDVSRDTKAGHGGMMDGLRDAPDAYPGLIDGLLGSVAGHGRAFYELRDTPDKLRASKAGIRDRIERHGVSQAGHGIALDRFRRVKVGHGDRQGKPVWSSAFRRSDVAVSHIRLKAELRTVRTSGCARYLLANSLEIELVNSIM
jgi:hypothetical protein